MFNSRVTGDSVHLANPRILGTREISGSPKAVLVNGGEDPAAALLLATARTRCDHQEEQPGRLRRLLRFSSH